MARFEVYVPAKEPGTPNVTLTIEANNWLGALSSGLKSLGEGQQAIADIMCDIKEDGSIHVSEMSTGRVFRLREKAPAVSIRSEVPPAQQSVIESPMLITADAPEAMAAPPPAVAPAPLSPSSLVAPASVPVAPMSPSPSPPGVVAAALSPVPMVPVSAVWPAASAPAPAVLPRRTTGQFASAALPVAREVTTPTVADPPIGRIPSSEGAAEGGLDVRDAIAAVFDATQDLYMQPSLSAQQVADKLLDIALSHIPAESGSFYLADVNGHELEFAAVRGPKADALKKSGVKVKVGQGIIGFCAQEGICVVVNDLKKDPRFLSAIAKIIDYEPRDTLCASAEQGGRLWGAVQIINSRDGFQPAHMEVLRFIGATAAKLLASINDRAGG